MTNASAHDSLEARLRSWLNQQGYPLEMELAGQLRKRGRWFVRQGFVFQDIETKKSREIDVVASVSGRNKSSAIHFAFECKSTKNPWVVFTAEDSGEQKLSRFALMTYDARRELVDLSSAIEEHTGRILKCRTDIPWLWDESDKGYAIAQGLGGDSAAPWGALQAVVKAAHSLLTRSPLRERPSPRTVAFPVIVISAPLFTCRLDSSSDIQLAQVDSTAVLFQHGAGDSGSTVVRVVTRKGLHQYLEECSKVVDALWPFLGSIGRARLNIDWVD